MNSTVHNGTVAWRAMLLWLDAQGGEATLQRAMAVWGTKHVIDANATGDVSCPRAQPGEWSMLVLTDQGRAKL
jgi:hypothetical protein